MNEKPSLFYVRYKDHVKFRNTDPSILKPPTREAVGWLVRETEEAIYICCERALEQLPFEKPSESGFIVLKSDILEMRRIKAENWLNCERRLE